MRAPVGAVVGLFCDMVNELRVGDALRTPTGRLYVVLERRPQRRGKHAGLRQHLRCQVATEVGEGTRVYSLRWYRRRKRTAKEGR